MMWCSLLALGGEGFAHELGGIALTVDLTAVGEKGHVEEIADVTGHVVDARKGLHVIWPGIDPSAFS